MIDAKFKPGDKVILGEHQELPGKAPYSKNWGASMDQYVGKQATITELYGRDVFGMMAYRVDIDEGAYMWREVNMVPVGHSSAKPTINGASCRKCKEFNSYADTINYTCYSCRH